MNLHFSLPSLQLRLTLLKGTHTLNKRTGPSLGAERAHVTILEDKSFDFPANKEKQHAW